MKKILIKYCIVLLFIYLSFKYNQNIKLNLIIIMNVFLKNIISSMFPIIFISNYIKYNILNNKTNKILKYISLCLSFAPSNALLGANINELVYSTNINPLFSYLIIKSILNKKTALIIVITNIVINYIFLYKNLSNKKIIHEKKNIPEIIKITTDNIINILGTTIFFNIFITILSNIIPSLLLISIEIINSYKIISSINNHYLRIIFCTFINTFCGIAIYFQIKSINNKIDFSFIIKKIFVSIIITIITFIIIMMN